MARPPYAPHFPPGVPAHWAVYFQVGDTDDLVTKLTSLGGIVHRAPFGTVAGRIAIAADPQSAAFCVIAPPPGQGE